MSYKKPMYCPECGDKKTTHKISSTETKHRAVCQECGLTRSQSKLKPKIGENDG